VKRLVPGTGTSYPAGFARLTDTRHLLVVIDEDQLDDQGDHPAGVTAMPSGESPDVEPSQDISPAPAVVAVERAEVPQAAAEEDAQAAGEPVAAKEPEAAPPSFESSVAAAGTVADQQPTETDHQANAVEAGPRASEAGQHDHWYFNTGDDDARQAEPEAPT
ncbi:PAS domain-containing sensor histidine kinase, partial [Mesorhizobium sp. M4B.F.Ca.ET.172.01.1.1]